jgi:hypothetical protein
MAAIALSMPDVSAVVAITTVVTVGCPTARTLLAFSGYG